MNAVAKVRSWSKVAFGRKRPEPSYPTLPLVNERGESNVRGLTMIGEVAGTPLIKLGLNAGHDAVGQIAKALGVVSGKAAASDDDTLDVLIIGAGSSGLGAAMRAHELGLKYLVLEGERIATTIVNMYKGKLLFAEPVDALNKSTMWFEECTREVLLERWHAQIESTGLRINEFEKVVDVQRRGDTFRVTSQKREYLTRRVLMAVGKAGNPRKAKVSGEKEYAAKLFHHLSDPGEYENKHIFIYGGGDVAAEAALALCENNHVTMVTIDEALVYPKKRNADALLAQQEARQLSLHLSSKLLAFDDSSVTFTDADGREQTIDNDAVFEMIGAELPLKFFKRIGIKLEGNWHPKRWIYLLLVSVGVYSLYALKKFPEQPYCWPFYLFIEEESFANACRGVFEVAFAPFGWLFSKTAYNDMKATTWFQQGYLYSGAYTVIMIVFGRTAFKRWSAVARNNRYQKWRFTSLVVFQVAFFFIVNVIAVQALSVQYSWRFWGLYAPWPLTSGTFNWWSQSDPRVLLYLFAGVGAFGFLVAIPLASRWHGKRFCTWICGCGGLAETLGDRWRHLSPKGKRSRSWDFQGVVVLVAAALVTYITVTAFGTRADNPWAKTYGYVVDFWLIAVIPVALYPFYGGKVWCRYWCPLAAWNGIWSKWIGKLKIKSNDLCITCTLCSRYCQVGVDVMHYAKNQLPFDNKETSCIHCGICIDVCPMDVLSFDTSGDVKIDSTVVMAALTESLPVSDTNVQQSGCHH